MSLPRHGVTLLCGPSGSGKSTLLRLLLGLIPQLSGGSLSGSVTVLGSDPTLVPPRQTAAAGVGLLFQNPVEGFVSERVLDEVAFGPENLGLAGEEIERRAQEALSSVGLAGYEQRRLRTLSTGQQQRVALAGVLALHPRFLLLDEPTAHLDQTAARQLLGVVLDVARVQRLGVLISEHRVGLLAPSADLVAVLVGGRLVGFGPPREVLADAALAAAGVPIPRAAHIAIALRVPLPVPLTPGELAATLIARGEASPLPRGESRVPVPSLDSTSEPVVAPEPAVLFEQVTYRYPGASDAAVSRVSFTLRRGEIAMLMGASGAGKTTLTRLVLGLLRPSAGRVWLDGLDTSRTPFHHLAERGGLVLQNPLLQLLAATVDAEIRLGLWNLSPAETDERVAESLDTFQLGSVRWQHPLAMSEGQRRRVALAATLARRPGVLVLDEPTLGQDDSGRAALEHILTALSHQGAAILCVTHDAEFANALADRTLVLADGQIAADVDFDAVVRHSPEEIERTGVPLADAPATALALRQAGWRLPPVRHAAELIAALS